MPAFAYRHIKDLYPTFWEKSSEMVKLVSSEIQSHAALDGSAVVHFASWLNRTTLDIIGTAGMEVEFGAIQNPDAELAVTYNKLFKPTTQAKILGLLSILLPWSIVGLIPVSRNETVEEAVATVKAASRKVIQEKKRKLAEHKGDRSFKNVDIISVALKSGGFSEEDLVIQTMTFLAAGHETTASTVKWALLILCRYPKIQQRLREEIHANLPPIVDNEASVSAEMFDKLPYLNAVCSEILRVWSPVAMTRREAIRDTTILGQFIPKGTEIHLSPYAVNMSKALWGPDALEFNPERWMGSGRGNSGGATSNYAMLSFLHGTAVTAGIVRILSADILSRSTLVYRSSLHEG
jgi:cytochrome P450